MTAALIRHGETDWNRDRRLQGQVDIPLNDTGRRQARDTVGVLQDLAWDVVVSSPLSRARETAEIIAGGLGLELGRSYPLLVERAFGDAEGATIEKIMRLWPNRDYPGMESVPDVVRRGTDALNSIADDYPGARVVVVCHGTLIRHTLQSLASRTFEQIDNGSVSRLARTDDQWTVLSVNGELLEAIPLPETAPGDRSRRRPT